MGVVVGIERRSGEVESEKTLDDCTSDQTPPSERPGESEGDSKSTAEVPGERKIDSPANPLENKPSYGGFENLAQELDARAKSRERAKACNAEAGDAEGFALDDKAIKEKIDPYAPDVNKFERYKDQFQPPNKDEGEGWSGGVDSFNDLPAGDELLEEDEEKSRAERFSAKMFQKVDHFDGNLRKLGNAVDKLIGPKPTGAETRVHKGPTAVDSHHADVDARNTVAALLALGVVGAQVVNRVHAKMKRREDSRLWRYPTSKSRPFEPRLWATRTSITD